MALSDITFTLTDGNLGRTTPNEDNISGLALYTGTVPAGFQSGTTVVYSLADAKNLGLSTLLPAQYYQVAEFYRINPGATLYIHWSTGYTSPNYQESIEDIMNFSDGKVKQIGVFAPVVVLTASTITTLNTIAENLATDHKPIVILAGFNTTGITLSNLPDLIANDKKYVSCVLAQDGAAYGAYITNLLSQSTPNVGLALGALAKAKVNYSIAWVDQFNLVGVQNNTYGEEMDNPVFGNGILVKNTSTSLLEAIENKGYIFARKIVGKVGTFFNKDMNSAAATSDYNRINKVRTINKAIRGIRTNCIGDLNSPILINPTTGKIAKIVCTNIQNKAGNALKQMLSDEEISGYDVYVDPNQSVLSTGKIVVSVKIVPYGIAESIEFQIGFTLSI